MQKLQLYIEGQELDLFKDETVSLTQTIQNVKEISKVFADFSKTFSLPASKNNNKIFKHYYNFEIQNGFDGRTKKAGTIELNGLPFRDGKIKLEGVDLKNNVPHTYRITFFGSTVQIKDLIGEDTLSALSNVLDLHNTIYSPSLIQAGLSANPLTTDLIVPLITHTTRLIYDSSAGHAHDVPNQQNLFYNSAGGHDHGVQWDDLKYAIRLDVIIKAIESQYGLVFSDDFFTSTNSSYYDLFIWLHRKKGAVESPGGLNQSLVNGFTNFDDLSQTQTVMDSNALGVFGITNKYLQFDLNLLTASSDSYIVSLQRNGLEVYNSGSVSGNLNITKSDFTLQNGNYTILISAEVNITFSDIYWEIEYRESNVLSYTKTYATSTYSHQNVFSFIITQQIPDVSIIAFLTSVFKTFNLTAYVDKDTSEIIVKPLDDFYTTGVSYDITKYVDTNARTVNVALPYRKINFEYEDTETFLAKIHGQLFGKEWGKEQYTNGEKLDGGIYDVKTSFSHLKYERLLNVNGGASTTIQYGYFVNDNQEATYGKPLLFYPVKQTSGTTISFMPTDTSHIQLSSYNIPSNSLSLVAATNTANINFFNENNEYTGNSAFTNTLFQVYYSNYITNIFNPSNRITKVTAYLPLRILYKFNLNDTFVINSNNYLINSITTNLQDGKSSIELLNKY